MKSDLRSWIKIVEGTRPAAKLSAEVKHYDGPVHQSSTVLDRIVIHAETKDDLHRKIKAWMEQIGLDPDDEDDLQTVNW